jgi:hypothetical protein
MANSLTVQTLLDNERNLVMKFVGILDTSNATVAAAVDVSALVPAADSVRIDEIKYSISAQLAVNLFWDATADVPIVSLTGYGKMCAKDFGGLTNNAGTGKTGDIDLTTTGWASGIQTYTLILKMVKNYASGNAAP